MVRYFLLLIAATFALLSCTPEQQLTDLSAYVNSNPSDGLGHYVYAITAAPTVTPGSNYNIGMEWRTVGPADPTSSGRYIMDVQLAGPATKVFTVGPSANTIGEYHLTNWLEHRFAIPADFPVGEYQVGVRVRDAEGAVVPLGFVEGRAMGEGFYLLTSVLVAG